MMNTELVLVDSLAAAGNDYDALVVVASDLSALPAEIADTVAAAQRVKRQSCFVDSSFVV